MPSDVRIDVEGNEYIVRLERRITGSMRDVLAVAWADGRPIAQQEMSTASARGYLHRDAQSEPATWTELEGLALDMLKLQLEDLAE